MLNRCIMLCLAFWLVGFQKTLTGQEQVYQISGIVKDSLTKEPIPFLTVFIPNTTHSVLTNENGAFTLAGINFSATELAFSHLNYGLKKVRIVQAFKKGQPITFLMSKRVFTVKEVEVKGKRNRSAEADRQYYFSIFCQFFLGDVKSRECKISNPEVIRFRREGIKILASASSPILITNERLGYSLTYYLDYFIYNDTDKYNRKDNNISFYSFQGVSLYKDLEAGDPATATKWKRNRTAEFSGSLSHFLSCLYMNQVGENGYTVIKAGIPDSLLEVNTSGSSRTRKSRPQKPDIDSVFMFDSRLNSSHFLHYIPTLRYPVYNKTRLMENSFCKSLKFNDTLLIFKNISDSLRFYDDVITLFHIGNGELDFYSNGDYQFFNGDLMWSSLDAKKKIINLLPLDYQPREIK